MLIEPADRVRAARRGAVSRDGSTRDVTRLAVFEPSNLVVSVAADGVVVRQTLGETAVLVRYLDRQATVQLAFVPARPDFVWQDRRGDELRRSSRLRQAAGPADHPVGPLLRQRVPAPGLPRPLGILPTAAEARAFLADAQPRQACTADRRTAATRPEFADFWALKWSDLLRNEEKVLDRKGVQAVPRLDPPSASPTDKPLNEFARDLIASPGQHLQPARRQLLPGPARPDARAEATAQVFLGVRLQCAKCHNHPFDRWTQHDYHSLAAFFARVAVPHRRKQPPGQVGQARVRRRADRLAGPAKAKSTHPRTGAVTATAVSRRPDAGLGPPTTTGCWLWPTGSPGRTTRSSPVPRSIASGMHLFGRGIVDPNDDFRASNPPVNAALLDALTRDFVDHHFDLRHLVRHHHEIADVSIVRGPQRHEPRRRDQFLPCPGPAAIQAEVLADALTRVVGMPVRFTGYPRGIRAGAVAGREAGERAASAATEGESSWCRSASRSGR